MIRFNSESLRAGLGSIIDRAGSVASIADHAGPLMERWERVIEEDNRQGVLAGLDKDGNPAPPLRYRPKGNALKLTAAQRLGQRGNKRRGQYMGSGPAASGWNNNLSTSEYRRLDGPRLAPRRQFSRVITNLVTDHGRDGNVWFAEGSWLDVVSRKGIRFLRFHFDGSSRLPKYDLRGVRPAGKAKLLESLVAWAKLEIRERFNKAG